MMGIKIWGIGSMRLQKLQVGKLLANNKLPHNLRCAAGRKRSIGSTIVFVSDKQGYKS
jgi:hypothetical protein